MKKLKKRLTAAAVAAIVMASAGITASAATDHTNPNTGKPCNSTYYIERDSTRIGTSTGKHGYSCTVTYYSYRHTKYCSCDYVYGEGRAYQCTEIHTCGNIIKDCGVVKKG